MHRVALNQNLKYVYVWFVIFESRYWRLTECCQASKWAVIDLKLSISSMFINHTTSLSRFPAYRLSQLHQPNAFLPLFRKTQYTSILRLACIQPLFSEPSIWSDRFNKIPKCRRDLLLQVLIRNYKRGLLVPTRQEDFLIDTDIQLVEAADNMS
jgi:hypothetical protein